MKLVEGQLVHRRYRLDSRIAQGGMGEVWKGYDIQLDRPVAIKALRSDTVNQESKLLRLRAEAHNSANLAHPNIAAMFEYYEHDGIGFLIMEYVPSKSLADMFHEINGPMDATELLPILVQTARGLYVAHSHGVIHRDIKPANIMVSDTGEVKITDFGVSYSTNQGQITQDGMVVGTAQYISPEQAQGEKASAQSDIYSLGVVAYEGLAGYRPFTGATPVDIAAAHVNNPVPPLPDSVDVQLREFVMSMLAKDPRDRPKDALTVARILSKIWRRLEDQQTMAETAVVTPTSSRRTPRRVTSTRHKTGVSGALFNLGFNNASTPAASAPSALSAPSAAASSPSNASKASASISSSIDASNSGHSMRSGSFNSTLSGALDGVISGTYEAFSGPSNAVDAPNALTGDAPSALNGTPNASNLMNDTPNFLNTPTTPHNLLNGKTEGE